MKNILLSILSALCIALCIALFFALYIAHNRPIMEKLGQTGDFIGGMFNPLFAFLSFVLLCYTVILQRKELTHSIEELKATRDELKATKEANQSMAKTGEQQRFENTFFSLLDALDKKIASKRNAVTSKDKSFVCYCVSCLKLDGNFKEISMMIYQILKFIDKNCQNGYPKTYSNFLRSSLDEDVLYALFIHCYILNLQNTPKSDLYANLIKTYTLFEHINLFSFSEIEINYCEKHSLKQLLEFYGAYEDDCGAFGDSWYLPKAKEKIKLQEQEAKNKKKS